MEDKAEFFTELCQNLQEADRISPTGDTHDQRPRRLNEAVFSNEALDTTRQLFLDLMRLLLRTQKLNLQMAGIVEGNQLRFAFIEFQHTDASHAGTESPEFGKAQVEYFTEEAKQSKKMAHDNNRALVILVEYALNRLPDSILELR